MKRVFKFGGSSVKDKNAMLRCAEIVKSEKDLSFVIISATYNTTNELEQSVTRPEVFLNLIKRHFELATELGVIDLCEEAIQELSKEGQLILEQTVDAKLMDQLYSIGERLSTTIFIHVLRQIDYSKEFELLDARDFIKTDSSFREAVPYQDLISNRLKNLKNEKVYLTQGFIGSDSKENTTTLGREGSDYSASLIANAINANEVVIWTDVPGVATADPKKIKAARFLKKLPYELATRLTELGSKVLFKRTLIPCVEKNIPLYVRSTFEPLKNGTCIHSYDLNDFPFIGLAVLKNEENEIILSAVGSNLQINKENFNFLKEEIHSQSFLFSEDSYEKLHKILIEKLDHK